MEEEAADDGQATKRDHRRKVCHQTREGNRRRNGKPPDERRCLKTVTHLKDNELGQMREHRKSYVCRRFLAAYRLRIPNEG